MQRRVASYAMRVPVLEWWKENTDTWCLSRASDEQPAPVADTDIETRSEVEHPAVREFFRQYQPIRDSFHDRLAYCFRDSAEVNERDV